VAWSPAREIKFQHIEGNIFIVQCSCLGDWIKVEKGDIGIPNGPAVEGTRGLLEAHDPRFYIV
jgi:hypothetical protein